MSLVYEDAGAWAEGCTTWATVTTAEGWPLYDGPDVHAAQEIAAHVRRTTGDRVVIAVREGGDRG